MARPATATCWVSSVSRKWQLLGIVGETYVRRHEGRVHAAVSFGRVIDRPAARYKRVALCAPVDEGPPEATREYPLTAANIVVIPQPFFAMKPGGLRHPPRIALAYARVCRHADVLFVRGMPIYTALSYAAAYVRRYKVYYLVVGNPVALLRNHRRAGRYKDASAFEYARIEHLAARLGRWLAWGHSSVTARNWPASSARRGQSWPSPARSRMRTSSSVPKCPPARGGRESS